MRGLLPISPKTTIHTLRFDGFLTRNSARITITAPKMCGSAQHVDRMQPVYAECIVVAVCLERFKC